MRARNAEEAPLYRAQIGGEGGTGPATAAVDTKTENHGKVI